MEPPSSPDRILETPSKSSVAVEQSPGTPKLPFDPPRRRSSLAFSKIISSPVPADEDDALNSREIGTHTPDRPKPDTSKKRTIATPFRQSCASPGHVAYVQRFFQSAKATLHLDMHFAASPEGSIDSRLPSSLSSTSYKQVEGISQSQAQGTPARSWRYSTMPQLLATQSLDVREPMPDASPTLPEAESPRAVESPMSFEPTSSGFASPVVEREQDITTELPPLPPSSPPESHKDERMTALEGPLANLRVDRDSLSEPSIIGNSPDTGHLRKSPATSSDSPIFLSQSANAAAASARAKRGLIQQPAYVPSNTNSFEMSTDYTQPITHEVSEKCPDPAIHQLVESKLCPDPEVHTRAFTPQSFVTYSPGPNARRMLDMYQTAGTPRLHTYPVPSLRASATGSPLPFLRPKVPLSPILPGGFPRQSHHASSPPTTYRVSRPCRQPQASAPPTNEHFQPGWYYARDSPQRQNRRGGDVYSFSTAAAKVTGEPVAPDCRIRDSYRTDTLTPLVKPLNRFRKNGPGAEINSRGSARFYGSPGLSDRPLGRMNTYSDRNDYENSDRVRFRSSPPRPSTSNTPGHDVRKRRRNPRAYTPEFDVEYSPVTSPRSNPDNAMIMNDDTRAAVRMSIFGSDTPEPLHGEREGTKELSPNVSMWRKGMHGGPHSRKKRRPSYWDGDLKEVKDSPAGRGGIESSPTISKRSMVAEMESVSNRSAAASISYDVSTMDGRILGIEEKEHATSFDDISVSEQGCNVMEMMADSMDVNESGQNTVSGVDPAEIDVA